MTFYGLADYRLSGSELGEVIEFFPSLELAEEALRDVIADESEWVGRPRRRACRVSCVGSVRDARGAQCHR